VKPQHTISVLFAIGLLVLGAGCASDSGSSPDDTTESSTRVTSSGSSDTTDTQPDLAERANDVRAALEAGDFSTTLDLLELSSVADEIEGREVTVLAPSEDAFGELRADELADLATDVDRSKELLRRHILDELYTYEELAQQTEVTTLSGDTLTVTTDGDTVMIEGVAVTRPKADGLAGEEGQEVAVFEIGKLLLDAG